MLKKQKMKFCNPYLMDWKSNGNANILKNDKKIEYVFKKYQKDTIIDWMDIKGNNLKFEWFLELQEVF